jgi:hypothetical protein
MAKWSGSLRPRYIVDLAQPTDAARCPKCLGLGSIVLMPGLAGNAMVEACPTCQGTGRFPSRNSYQDPLPASIVTRAR